MSILTRAKQIIFGDSGGTGEFGQIGSKAAGAPATTKDLTTMQSLTEYLQGLNAIVSDQGTSVLPYLEDMNSLFFLTTSQLAYLFQAGVPKWEIGTDYYEFVSIVEDEGMLWLSIDGVDPTPNTGNKPSTNQLKWIPLSIGIKTSVISVTGAFTTEYRTHKITSDTSGGSNTITLSDGKFNGQKIEIVSDGSGLSYIKGTGLYLGASSLGIPVSDGLSLRLTWNSNLTKWIPVNEDTADYVSGDYKIKQSSVGNLKQSFLDSIDFPITVVFNYPISFSDTTYRSYPAGEATGAQYFVMNHLGPKTVSSHTGRWSADPAVSTLQSLFEDGNY